MAELPVRPPAALSPLAPGWTEHSAPSGHTYYYNKETKKSTYTRPILYVPDIQTYQSHPLLAPIAPTSRATTPSSGLPNPPVANNQFNPNFQQFNSHIGGPQQQPFQNGPLHHLRGGHRGGNRGDSHFQDRRRQPEDRPKHRFDIPDCAPWVLIKTKLGRRFVWNKDTNESVWKFPPNVIKAVVEFDRRERDKKERRARGELRDGDEDTSMAEIEADLAAAEEEIEQKIVEVDGGVGMDNDSEYEEVEVTDDEGEEGDHAPKRQRTEEPAEDQAMEMGEDDIAWQLAQMEAMDEGDLDEEEEEGLPLTEEDCKALFKELLDDTQITPYAPWVKVLENDGLYEDERYKALPTMKARKDCFDEWARERIQYVKEQKTQQQKLDPMIPYLAFLHRHATPKLYWPEFRRKFKKEPEMKDIKVPDKDKERLYRDHIKRLGSKQAELRSDLSALLKAQPLTLLNGSTSLGTLPFSVLTDLRFISLPASTRDSLVETYISTLPPAPEGATASAKEIAEVARKRAERERRERALAERERRVREDKRKQDRDLAYGKGRLREEEMEIERAMQVGKSGLKGQLDS